jgi:hypothetical protein
VELEDVLGLIFEDEFVLLEILMLVLLLVLFVVGSDHDTEGFLELLVKLFEFALTFLRLGREVLLLRELLTGSELVLSLDLFKIALRSLL